MATDQLSAAFVNLSSLVKICNEETSRIILRVSAWPLVQINILENFLNPVAVPVPPKEGKEQPKKIQMALLLKPSAPVLLWEPKNSTTRLLTAVVYFKLKRRFFNEGTQAKVVEKFKVNTKALSKLLTGCQYMGGSKQKKKQTTIIPGEKGKLALSSKRKSVPSKVVVKDLNDSNDDDDEEEEGSQHPLKK